MLEIIECEQGTDAWREARRGIPTASNFQAILTKGGGVTRRTYLYKLAAERITGELTAQFSNGHTERGNIDEPYIRELYAEQSGYEIKEVGFMRLGNIGYSPDGLVGDDGLIEIKSKLPHLQIACIISNEVPSEHIAQIQGGLYISGRQWCDFISYCQGLPNFYKRVYRDEEYIENLKTELDKFETELQEAVNTVMEYSNLISEE